MKTNTLLRERATLLVRVAGLLLMALLLLLIIGYLVRTQARKAYPLVSIHNPENNERIALGDLADVHASASSPEGVERIELWADGAFIEAMEPEDETHSLLVLNAGWEPRTLGRHILVVRAVSSSGVESQATVYVEAVEGQGKMAQHMLVEDETLEQLAADHGLEADELIEMNPGLDPLELESGDFVNVPGGASDAGGDDGASPDSSSADEAPPDSSGRPLELPFFPFTPTGGSDSRSDEPLVLRLETLSLETGAAYESLHCYVGVGDRSPRWYPDTDGDQATSEYFTSADGSAWNVDAYMTGSSAPAIYWPGNQTLPFTITCVGIQGGGTDALDLGPLSLSIPPESWDGVIRMAHSESGEGSFSIEYRVTLEDLTPKGPNRDMARPINLWINYNGGYVAWDYRPEEDAEAIDGFMVFLNDTLIWQESADARRSWLPDAFLIPPCGEVYEFTVEAFIEPYPVGDHSVSRETWEDDYQGDRASISGDEPGTSNCAQRYIVDFQSLTTGDIPEDPVDWPAVNWDHGAGPISGMFYTNHEVRPFDFWRFVPNSEYSAVRLMPGSATAGSILITFDEDNDESFWVGFRISDGNEDGYSVLCHGIDFFSPVLMNNLGFYEGEIASHEDGGRRCRVAYTIRPADGSPVGSGGDTLALPQLEIEDFTAEPGSGRLQIHVRNIGTADWAHKDLDIHMTTRQRDLIDDITWEDFSLRVGETAVLVPPGANPDPTFDVCVTLDPQNNVLELYEHVGSTNHGRICPSLPDLSISDVQYDPAAEALMITVQNHGELLSIGRGIVDDQDIDLRIEFDDDSHLNGFFHNVSMNQNDETVLRFTGIGDAERTRMFAGYSVTVDPHNFIAEVDEHNNEYLVLAGRVVTVSLLEVRLYALPIRSHDTCHVWRSQEQTASVQVFVESDYESNRIASWSFTQDITNWVHILEFDFDEHQSQFRIAGDQILTIQISGEVNDDDMGSARISYRADTHWTAPTSATRYSIDPPGIITCRGPWSVEIAISSRLP
jgi:hypothetical protein